MPIVNNMMCDKYNVYLVCDMLCSICGRNNLRHLSQQLALKLNVTTLLEVLYFNFKYKPLEQ